LFERDRRQPCVMVANMIEIIVISSPGMLCRGLTEKVRSQLEHRCIPADRVAKTLKREIFVHFHVSPAVHLTSQDGALIFREP
jgi:hypothetical protein